MIWSFEKNESCAKKKKHYVTIFRRCTVLKSSKSFDHQTIFFFLNSVVLQTACFFLQLLNMFCVFSRFYISIHSSTQVYITVFSEYGHITSLMKYPILYHFAPKRVLVDFCGKETSFVARKVRFSCIFSIHFYKLNQSFILFYSQF